MKAIKFVLVFALIAPAVLPLTVRAEKMTVPDLDESRLTIPWSDFKNILEMISEREGSTAEEIPTPPMDYTITSARYIGKREDKSAVFQFTIAFTVLADKKWVMVPVLPSQLAVEELSLDGREALATDRDGWHQLLLLGPGQHTVVGKFYQPFGNELGPATVSVPLPKTPVTTLDFVVPEPGLDIKAEPASVSRMTWPEGQSSLSAVLPATDRVKVSWGRKIEGDKAELRVNASVESLVSLGERLCQVESVVRYEIMHRAVSSFKLSLPASVSVVDVRGAGLADWKAEKKGDTQQLNISLNYEAKGKYDLTVIYELALETATAEVTIPELTVKDVNREVGNVGVTALTNIEVTETKREDLAVLDVSQLPDSLVYRSGSSLLFGYKYTSHPWALILQTTRHDDVPVPTMMIKEAKLHTFITPEGRAITRAVYAMFNNREQFIRLELPEGAKILSAARSDRPVKPAADGKLILLPLEKAVGASGQPLSFTVEITYLLGLGDLKTRNGKLLIPAPKVNVQANAIEWRVFLPADFNYEVNEKITTMHLAETSIAVDESGRRNLKLQIESGKSKSDLNAWVETINGANDAYNKDRAVQAEEKRNFNIFLTDGDQTSTDVTPTANVLPVLFEVPEKGLRIDFEKSLAAAGEPDSITIAYKKKLHIPPETRRIAVPAAIVFAVCFLVWMLIRIRRKRQGVSP